MEKKLYQCVILSIGETGYFESIVQAPEWTLARSEQDAVVKFTAEHSHMITGEVKVLVRPFV